MSDYLITTGDRDAIGRFVGWLAKRQPVYVHETKGRRLDMGHLQNYRRAESWMREGRGSGNA